MPGTRSQRMQEFTETAEAAGLKDTSVRKLIEQDIDATDVVSLLSEADITDLQLSRGQTLVLRRWVKNLNTETPESVPDVQAEPSLDELLEQLDGDTVYTPTEPTADNKTPGKPLYITDFLNRANVGLSDIAEREVCTQDGAQLVLRSTRQKPLPEQVTLAQWVGANARIMERLIRSRQLQSVDELCQYLEYTVKFSDFAQVNELPSVMLYDLEFRRKQFEKQRAWNEDDFHLANFFLKKKSPSNQPSVHSQPRRRSDQNRRYGTEVCWDYNNRTCLRNPCRFAHVCSVCKSSSHSKASHTAPRTLNPTAPSFPGQTPH